MKNLIIILLTGLLLPLPHILNADDNISKYVGMREGELTEVINGKRIVAAIGYPISYVKKENIITEIVKINYVAFEDKDKILVLHFLNNVCIGCNYTEVIYYNTINLAKLKNMNLTRVLKKFGQPFMKGLYDIAGLKGEPGKYYFAEYIINKPDTYLSIFFNPVNNKVVDYKIHYNK